MRKGLAEMKFCCFCREDLTENLRKRLRVIYATDTVWFLCENSSKMEERILKGVRQVYIENASYFDNVLEVKDSYNATYELIKEKLPTMKNSLFIATRDSIALAALNAALDLNYKVPEDFEFMAMIGTKYSELTRPKLSSFNIDMRGLGKEGMRVLSELILDNGKIIQKKLPFVFVKRGSTL